MGLARLQVLAVGHSLVDALVIAILLGATLRSIWAPPESVTAGIDFSARTLLEVAVFLLGVSIDLPMVLRAGPLLALGIVLLVVTGFTASLLIGRVLGLPPKLAILVASGNAICGNSAIAAVATVIKAEKEQVASAIAFTAILGVLVVLALPLLIGPLNLNHYQYGVFAGLTVYAVPQVLAATFPVSVLSGQVGTLVKLVRVLLLGPLVLFFALRARDGVARSGLGVTRFIPWFIVGFLMLAVLRSSGMLPESLVAPTRLVSSWLTLAAMAGLGLSVDLRDLARVGKTLVIAVSGSLIVLVSLAVALIRLLGIS